METKIIGSKIAEARKKINISQAQLAQRIFISPQAVGKWERGESIPDILTFNRLAKILGVDLNYFSEDFQSLAIERTAGETMLTQSDEVPSSKVRESPSGKRMKRPGWDMSRGNWVDADFSGLKNLHEKFSSSNMKDCKFTGSDLSGLILSNNNVDGCDFTSSDISNSHIQGSNLGNNVFKDCSLQETEFSKSNISGCDFSDADFTDAVFRYSNFEKNNLAQALWKRSSFIAMNLAEIVFDGKLEDCYFENCSFYRVSFLNATLTNSFFKCKSLKRIKFIDCQADRMTYEFLKNGKADLSGITLLKTQENNKYAID